MMRRFLSSCAALLCITTALCPSLSRAADEAPDKPVSASVAFGAELTSGGQAGGSNARGLYVPLIFTWFPTERIDGGIEVPFIAQRESNPSWHMYQNNQSALSGMTTRGGGSGSGVTTGLGDIILRAGMIEQFETESLPQFRPSVYVKCPTASKSDGLGTGEFDAGVGMEAVKWFGDMQLSGDVFYNYQGKAAYYDLTDYFSYTAGVGWQVSKDFRSLLLVKGSTSPARDSGGLRETRIRLLWALDRSTTLDLFVSRGSAAASPDYGGGLVLIYSY